MVTPESIFKKSEDIVARDIEGDTLIVPITSGIGDMEDDLYCLQSTGQAVWRLLDGVADLREISETLAGEYDIAFETILEDVCGLLIELEKRKIVVPVG
jgi:hypothetical protein